MSKPDHTSRGMPSFPTAQHLLLEHFRIMAAFPSVIKQLKRNDIAVLRNIEDS